MTDETPKKKPAKGAGSAKRTDGDKGRFAKIEVNHDAVFDLYYAMGGGRSFHKLVGKVAEELGASGSVQSLARWSTKEDWADRVKVRDVETGAHIAELLKDLEQRGEKVSAAHFKGLLGYLLQAAKAGALNVSIKTPADLEKEVEVCIRLEEHAAKMSQTAGPLHATNGNGKVVNMGDFTAAARAAGAAAPAPNGNGKDRK